MAEKTRKVTLAVARVIDGKTVKADTTVSLPDIEARDLIRAGHARAAVETPTPPASAVETPTTKGK